MKWKPLALVLGIGAILVAALALLLPKRPSSRGVRLLSETSTSPTSSRPFDRTQSAGLFIGVRTFTQGQTVDVPYAADDAVDLAYAFALDPRVSLVLPEHVVIALSGRPQKEESRQRLAALKEAGAKVAPAGQADILTLLQRQAAAAGKDGILIVTLASHGFLEDGVPYVLGSSSLFQYPETTVPATRLFDVAAKSEAGRSLFFIDACRERITGDRRGSASAKTSAPMIHRMGLVHGQVVFYAAAAGGYAYDDGGNGVFTKAVLEGLHCNAAWTRGVVTVETLRTYVEKSVRTWIRKNRDPSISSAIQVNMDGDSKNMPLAACASPPGPPPPGNVDRALSDGSNVVAFSADGRRLWTRDLGAPVSRVEVADLDADGSREVVAGAQTIVVLDRMGKPVWSAGEGNLLGFLVDDLSLRGPSLEVLALWDDAGSARSRVSRYSAQGLRLSTYEHPGRLQHIAIDRPTLQHDRKVILTGVDDQAGSSFGVPHPLACVTVLDLNGKPVWAGVLFPFTERIARLEIVDSDNDSRRDISLRTATGQALHLDFAGKVLAKSKLITLELLPRKTRHRHQKKSGDRRRSARRTERLVAGPVPPSAGRA